MQNLKHLSKTRKLFIVQAFLLAASLMLQTCCYAADSDSVNYMLENTLQNSDTGFSDTTTKDVSRNNVTDDDSAISADTTEETSQEYILPVFETTDIHGHMVDMSGEDYLYRLAYIIDKVNDIRTLSGEADVSRTILLDSGDIYQGTALSSVQRGNGIRQAFASAAYDAVGIGNHEFDWEIDVSVDSDATMADYTIGDTTYSNNIPVLCSNMYKYGQKVQFGQDYVILNKTAYSSNGNSKNVRVAVIGCVEEYSSSIMTSKFTGLGYTIDSDYSKIENMASSLKASGLCDTVIMLCHGDAEEVAEKMDDDTQIDLVLGGHSHKSECGVTDGGLQYLEAYCYGQAYGYCELVFTADEDDKVSYEEVRNAKVVELEDTELLLNNEDNIDELDADIVEITDNAISQSSELLSRVIGYITDDADRDFEWETNVGNCNMANWMGKIMRAAGNSDVAFINGGGVRTEILLDEGSDRKDITEAYIYNIFPFENQIYTFEITYPMLLSILDYAVDGEHNILFKFVSGIDCYYDSDNNITGIVKDGKLIYNGKEWSDTVIDKTIRVSVADFVATSSRITSDGRDNPLVELYASGSYEIASDVDRECALTILEEEAANNNGHLTFDTGDHYICGQYDSSYDSTFVKHDSSIDSKSRAASTGDDNSVWLYVILLVITALYVGIRIFDAAHLQRSNEGMLGRRKQ